MGQHYTKYKLEALDELCDEVDLSLIAWEAGNLLGSDAEILFKAYLEHFLYLHGYERGEGND